MPDSYVLWCPKCGNICNHTIVCDNGCNTIFCNKCTQQFYVDSVNVAHFGHNPMCELE